MSLLELLHLVEAELERRLALEDGDENLELLGLGHDLGDRGRHGLERPVGDGDDLADLELGLDDLDGCGLILGGESGTGLCWSPTKPVTAGVSLTTRYEASLKSMQTIA